LTLERDLKRYRGWRKTHHRSLPAATSDDCLSFAIIHHYRSLPGVTSDAYLSCAIIHHRWSSPAVTGDDRLSFVIIHHRRSLSMMTGDDCFQKLEIVTVNIILWKIAFSSSTINLIWQVYPALPDWFSVPRPVKNSSLDCHPFWEFHGQETWFYELSDESNFIVVCLLNGCWPLDV